MKINECSAISANKCTHQLVCAFESFHVPRVNFISGTRADPTLKRTRVSVKVLEGKDLLVSDLLTGTSDPVALLWVGACDEGDADLGNAQRVQVHVSHDFPELPCALI